MHGSIGLSPRLWCARARPSSWNSVEGDSWLKSQCILCLRSHLLWVLPHTAAYPLWSKVNLGHLGTRLNREPTTISLFTIIWTDNLYWNWRIVSTRRREADMKQLSLCIRIHCLYFRAVVKLPRPPRRCWRGAGSVSQMHCKLLLTHPMLLTKQSCHFLLRIVPSWQSNNAPQFALANYTSWCLRRMIESTKWFSEKQKQYQTVSLIGTLHL